MGILTQGRYEASSLVTESTRKLFRHECNRMSQRQCADLGTNVAPSGPWETWGVFKKQEMAEHVQKKNPT